MGPNGPGIDVAAKWSSRVQGSGDPVGVGPLLRAGWEPLKKLAEPGSVWLLLHLHRFTPRHCPPHRTAPRASAGH